MMEFFTHRSFTYQVGDEIAGYRIVALSGVGGFGEVYLVEDVSGARFALKLFSDRRELDALSRYREVATSPHLATIHAAGTFQDQTYYLTDGADNLREFPDYLPDTLANRLAKGAFSAVDALQTIRLILCGAESLHKQNLAHGDLKPENVIFVKGELKIADFGSLASPESTGSGTGGFLPPETVAGIPTLADGIDRDLYAAGKMLYVLYSNRAPEEFPLPREHAQPGEFAAIRKIYAKACHEKNQYRFHSAAEMRQAVDKALCNLQSKPGKRHWKTLVITLFSIVVVTVAAAEIYRWLELDRWREREKVALFLAGLNANDLREELHDLEIMRSVADPRHADAIDRRIADVTALLRYKEQDNAGAIDARLRRSLPLARDPELSAYRNELQKSPLNFLTPEEWQESETICKGIRPPVGRGCFLFNKLVNMRKFIQEYPGDGKASVDYAKAHADLLKEALRDWKTYKESQK